MSPHHSGLHLISADVPDLAIRLLGSDTRLSAAGARTQVIDLSGDQWLATGQTLPEAATLLRYAPTPYALHLWSQLEPRLAAWLQLLELADRDPLLIPPLPGVEMVLRCLYLAESLDQAEMATVLLPAPAEAMALLELARTGPALIDTLLDPLLQWWDQTRQALASLELVLRLRLPSSAELRLTPAWRSRLERLAQLLSEVGDWDLSLILHVGCGGTALLGQRLGCMAMRGFMPTRLGLHGEGTAELKEDPPSWWSDGLGAQLLSTGFDPGELTLLLQGSSATGSRSRLERDGASQELVVPLPGIDKDQLDIRQVGDAIVVMSLGLRRRLELPPQLRGSQCTGASLQEGLLRLRFG
jgi:arsenite-transporting ATPase